MYKDSIQARREIARILLNLIIVLTLCTGRRCAWALIATFRPKIASERPGSFTA
jgi:hypothetical protein